MGKLKILHLITGLNVGGAEMMLYKLLSRMDRQRFDNVVVSLMEGGPLRQKIEELDVPVYGLGMQPGQVRLGQIRKLLRLLQQEDPFILQTWMYHADLLGLIAGTISKVPRIVWNVRCSNMSNLPRSTVLTSKLSARLSSKPYAAIVNSEAGRAFHSELGYHPRQWIVIPNGFNLDGFAPDPEARESVRAELGVSSDTILIGLVGRYDPMKDHENFFRAAACLSKNYPQVHFVLAGRDVEPNNSHLAEVISGHPAESCIHLLGERSDVSRLTAAFDIASSSSAYGEGFANVIGEAMSCGVPCVVTDVGDSALIVGDTGIVVPPRDAEALAHGWQQLIEAGAEGRAALGQAARKRIEQNYSLAAVVQKYEDLYESLRSN
jgi:glycosyltransferase involved in cell wall biosynthesis